MKVRMYASHFDRKYVDGLVNGIGVLNVVVSQILGWFDQYIVDGVIKLITTTSGSLGNVARGFQNGRIQMYFVWAVLGIVLVLIVLF